MKFEIKIECITEYTCEVDASSYEESKNKIEALIMDDLTPVGSYYEVTIIKDGEDVTGSIQPNCRSLK